MFVRSIDASIADFGGVWYDVHGILRTPSRAFITLQQNEGTNSYGLMKSPPVDCVMAGAYPNNCVVQAAWRSKFLPPPPPAQVKSASLHPCTACLPLPHLVLVGTEASVHLETRAVLFLAALHAGAGALSVDGGGRTGLLSATQLRGAPAQAEAALVTAARVLLQVITHLVIGIFTAGAQSRVSASPMASPMFTVIAR